MKSWSARPGSNRRPSAWEAVVRSVSGRLSMYQVFGPKELLAGSETPRNIQKQAAFRARCGSALPSQAAGPSWPLAPRWVRGAHSKRSSRAGIARFVSTASRAEWARKRRQPPHPLRPGPLPRADLFTQSKKINQTGIPGPNPLKRFPFSAHSLHTEKKLRFFFATNALEQPLTPQHVFCAFLAT